jgi:hypothetical protein
VSCAEPLHQFWMARRAQPKFGDRIFSGTFEPPGPMVNMIRKPIERFCGIDKWRSSISSQGEFIN